MLRRRDRLGGFNTEEVLLDSGVICLWLMVNEQESMSRSEGMDYAELAQSAPCYVLRGTAQHPVIEPNPLQGGVRVPIDSSPRTLGGAGWLFLNA